jgi:hypothetical protein
MIGPAALFGLVPSWAWAALLAASCAAGWWQNERADSAELELAELKAQVAGEEATRTAAARTRDHAERVEEARRADSTRKAIEDAHLAQDTARRDAAGARTELERLRKHAAGLAAARCAGRSDPAPTSSGPPAQDPGLVLADMLGRAAERAQKLAALADDRGIAGAACEAHADGLTHGRDDQKTAGLSDLADPARPTD